MRQFAIDQFSCYEFIECGPGKVLTNINKRIDKGIKVNLFLFQIFEIGKNEREENCISNRSLKGIGLK